MAVAGLHRACAGAPVVGTESQCFVLHAGSFQANGSRGELPDVEARGDRIREKEVLREKGARNRPALTRQGAGRAEYDVRAQGSSRGDSGI